MAWWAEGSEALPNDMRALIDNARNEVFISAVSAFEIAQKHRVGKWPGGNYLLAALSALIEDDFVVLPLSFEHAQLAGTFPGKHRDPFDRMLAAQALAEDLIIISVDDKLDQFGVRRLW